jgi:hypothetical protein
MTHIQKPAWRYWPFRLSVIVGQPLLCGLLPMMIYYISIGKSPILMFPAYFALIGVNALTLLSWCVFPFDYSIMGKFERTPPKDIVFLARVDSPVIIKNQFRSGFPAIWQFSDDAVHLTIPLIGRVLVPFASIDRITQQRGGWFFLDHHCEEIRSPIRIRNDVFEQLQYRTGRNRDQGEVA